MANKTNNKTKKKKGFFRSLAEGNVGNAIEVLAKPIAKAIGLDEECEGCKGRKQALNFKDKRERTGLEIERADWEVLDNYFNTDINRNKTTNWRFVSKGQAKELVALNNKYMPSAATSNNQISCPRCINNLMARIKPLWENKNIA